MRPRTGVIDSKLVYLDSFLLDRLRVNAGLSRKSLAVKAQVAFNTVQDLFAGNGTQPLIAHRLAKTLGREVVELLAPCDPRYVAPAELSGPWSGAAEWETEGYLDQGRLASNGLYYIVCRMRHRHTAGKFGRGKFYHLSWLSAKARDERRHQLSRHAEVSAQVGIHPQIVTTLASSPAERDAGWWVVDDWVGQQTLGDRLAAGVWPRQKLPRLLWEVAQGLAALHAAGIVFRELAPARVLIADKDGRAVLTDFELAKLLEGSPSVSSEWPEDPFRAPEIDGGHTTARADLYSFGQLVAAAITGPEFEPGQAVAAVTAAGLPKRVQSQVLGCLEPVPDRRPPDLTRLLSELKRWAEQ